MPRGSARKAGATSSAGPGGNPSGRGESTAAVALRATSARAEAKSLNDDDDDEVLELAFPALLGLLCVVFVDSELHLGVIFLVGVRR